MSEEIERRENTCHGNEVNIVGHSHGHGYYSPIHSHGCCHCHSQLCQCGRCHRCTTAYNCNEPTLRERDDTKENRLVIDGDKDLLSVNTGVPSQRKTILTVKRDNTKEDKTDHDRDHKELLGKITAIENKLQESHSNLFLTEDTKQKINKI